MKKKMTVLAATMLMGALLAGCGNSASGRGTEAVGEAGTKSEKKITMSVACLTGGNNEAYAKLIETEINEFNKTNQYNVELVQEAYSNEQYKTKITTLMASNAQPDIFFTFEAGFLKPFVEGGKIYSIGDAIGADEEWSSRFNDKSVFGPVTFDGKIYAVPNTRQVVVVTYNKKLFEEIGVKAPTTYDEFLAVCEALKNNGKTALIVPCQEAWYAGQLLQQIANGIGGSKLYEETRAGETDWKDGRYVQAGERLTELVQKGYLPEGFLGMTPNEGFEKFNNGEAGMIMNLTSAITMFNNKDNPLYNDIDFFVLPAKEEQAIGVNVGSTGQMYAVSSKAEHVEAACAFVKQLSEIRYQQELVNLGQVLVTNVKVDRDNVDAMALRMQKVFPEVKIYTPWFDRIFATGEGTEFNNIAVAIMAGGSPEEQFANLQQFADDNAER
ncbi:MAG: extracellular solute-binding protein [Paenibacillaceae bacterium]|nr:extracellular solute-binding protein [Paenibacillaceae bacterium]